MDTGCYQEDISRAIDDREEWWVRVRELRARLDDDDDDILFTQVWTMTTEVSFSGSKWWKSCPTFCYQALSIILIDRKVALSPASKRYRSYRLIVIRFCLFFSYCLFLFSLGVISTLLEGSMINGVLWLAS